MSRSTTSNSVGARRYRVARVVGMRHHLYRQDGIKVVDHLWLRSIESGYFDRAAKQAI